MADSTPCRIVANKITVLITTANKAVGKRLPILRPNIATALRFINPKPMAWMTTVITINGSPHAQSVLQTPGAPDWTLRTLWAIIIERSSRWPQSVQSNCLHCFRAGSCLGNTQGTGMTLAVLGESLDDFDHDGVGNKHVHGLSNLQLIEVLEVLA